MNNKTHFTIIIPTRERSDTLMHTISSALAQQYENFCVLVSDNASCDDTEAKVKSIGDHRLRYVNTGRRLSMSENWEFALNHISNGWVTVLGDDDGILPGALARINEIINKTGVQAVRANGCGYSWPSLLGRDCGVLNVCLSNKIEIRNSSSALQSVLDGKMQYAELPMLYNGGFIDSKLVEKAREISGKMFMSMTPDVYSAIVFSYLTNKYAYSYEPLAINGASHHSGGTAAFEKTKRKRNYDPAKKFLNESNLPFHKSLPLNSSGFPVRSIQVLIYESFLQAQPFHHLKKIITTHQKQLEIISRKSGPDPEEIQNWCEVFADMHNLQNCKSGRCIWKKDLVQIVRNFSQRLRKGFQTVKIKGDQNTPLSNVFEATVVAGAVKKLRPNPIKVRFLR